MTRAVVIGAGGGIGRALVEALSNSPKYDQIWALTRKSMTFGRPNIRTIACDTTHESELAQAACTIGGTLTRVIVTTGMLHDPDQRPEKSWRDLDSDRLARSFAINTIAPALAAKHFIPLLERKTSTALAFLSARVGSISDNRAGGWHGYRASKAALNMIVRNLAIELARTHPELTCVALHPGTVDTEMSKPFQGNVPPDKLFTPAFSARAMLKLLDDLTPAQSGLHYAWNGSEILA